METFKNLVWNVPVELQTDFATAEEFKSESVTYKILHGSSVNAKLSSDSSDESMFEIKSPPKKPTKKKKKKNKKINENATNDTEAVNNFVEETVVNEDGVRYSTFNAAQHAAFVDILCAVQHQKITIPPQWMQMKEAVEKEQQEFLKHIKELWNTAYEKHHVLSDAAQRFTEDKWKLKLRRVKSHPQFYTVLKNIPLVYPEGKPEVQIVPLQVLLEMGVVPKLHVPCDKTSTKISTDYSKMLLLNAPHPDDASTLLHVPVSADKNAEMLAVKERADIVISSSSLKCIADNTSSKFDKIWNIPTVVKQYSIKDGTSFVPHKVVYIDKRLPSKNMKTFERNIWFHKLAVKCLMCNHRDPMAFRYPENQPTALNVEFNSGEQKPENKIQDIRADVFCDTCKLFKKKYSQENINSAKMDEDSSDGSELVIDTNDDRDSEKICVCDIKSPENENDGETSIDKNIDYSIIPPSSKTNVTYRLWKFNCEERSKEDLNEKFLKGQSLHKELRVLVRCKMDACECENNQVLPVCISCKLEYQAEYGAEKINVSALVREWIALLFRPEAFLRRIRIDAMTEEVIMTEKVMLRDLTQMAMQIHNIRIRRTVLGSLYQVMEDLVMLKPGYFLLSHDIRNGPFICVLQQSNTNLDYNLYADYESVNPAVIIKDDLPQWTPIDTNLVTQMHIATKQIPATFQPTKQKQNAT